MCNKYFRAFKSSATFYSTSLLVIFSSSLLVCQMITPIDTIPVGYDHYTGATINGNYLWTGAMNLCWTELCESVIKAPVLLRTADTSALQTTEHLNHPVITRNDLDATSYYIKSGFGPNTLETINRECRSKFPQKSFADIEVDLAAEDIISYAYFYKNIQYEIPFTRKTVRFDTSSVKGFEAVDKQKQTVEVLHYESNDRFVIRLRLKEKNDELILAKGYAMDQPADVLQALDSLKSNNPKALGEDDRFQMPLLQLDVRRDYNEMIGQPLDNSGFRDYRIGEMFENIAFALDETGAKVESQAVIAVERSAFRPGKQIRYFYLDKPFWVIMKQRDSARPYFLLGVNQTNIMQTP